MRKPPLFLPFSASGRITCDGWNFGRPADPAGEHPDGAGGAGFAGCRQAGPGGEDPPPPAAQARLGGRPSPTHGWRAKNGWSLSVKEPNSPVRLGIHWRWRAPKPGNGRAPCFTRGPAREIGGRFHHGELEAGATKSFPDPGNSPASGFCARLPPASWINRGCQGQLVGRDGFSPQPPGQIQREEGTALHPLVSTRRRLIPLRFSFS